MELQTLLDLLDMKRVGYEPEAVAHKFLLDAYGGTGGFGGRIRLPESSWWGAAADIYSQFSTSLHSGLSSSSEESIDTYLDRYPREDLPKFKRRAAVAHYPNYVEPILNTVLSHYHRKEPVRTVPGSIEEWMQDVNGTGFSWEQMMRIVVTARAAVLGWCPVLGDMDPIPDDVDPEEFTAAAAAEHGIRFRAIPLLPANLLDWDLDENGDFVWVKVRIDRIVRDGPFSPGIELSEYTIWTKETATVYQIGRDRNSEEERRLLSPPVERPHPFGTVPIRICKARSIPNEPVKGRPMGYSISVQGRRLFNLHSEMDEHIASNVFAMLQVPTEDPEAGGEFVIGAGNALFVHPDWKNEFKWLAPDTSVATIIENRMATTVTEMYRMAQQEFSRGTKAPVSGISAAFEFEGTNRKIADFAQSVATFEEEFLSEVVAAGMQPVVPEAQRDAIKVTAHQKFNVEELLREIEEAMRLVDADLGETATSELKRRLVKKALPNLTPDQMVAIESEIEALAIEKAQERAVMLALAGASVSDEEDVADDDADDEENGANDGNEDD